MKSVARKTTAALIISRAFRLVAVLWIGAALVGCDEQEDNYLKGSLVKAYKIKFDSTRVRLYTSELSIEYVTKGSQGELISLRVTVDAEDEGIQTGQGYDLMEQGAIQRGQGFGSELPEMLSGTLTFSDYIPQDGGTVSGEFQAVFLGTNGAQLSLRGGFGDSLEVVQ